MKQSRAFVLILFSLAFAGFVFLYTPGGEACSFTKETKTVRGDSLDGILKPGVEVTLLRGYYICHEVGRGDIVAYAYGGNDDPIIKRALGISGDRFEVRSTEDGESHIFINGLELRTTKGEPYAIDVSYSRILELYERDYKGVIPVDAYLILGNLPGGTMDSTKFGFVSRDDIIGKIVY